MTEESSTEKYSRAATPEEVQAEVAALACPIAYTVGSLWYCPEHGKGREGASPVRWGNTLPQYEYVCDHCGKMIQEKPSGESAS